MAKTLNQIKLNQIDQIDHELYEERNKLLEMIDEYNQKYCNLYMLAHSCGKNIYDLSARAIDYE